MTDHVLPALTPELTERICAFIRSGGFPHVAAAAVGVAPGVFSEWLANGRRRDGSADCRHLASEVMQAAAQARLRLEMAVYKNEPVVWLTRGPGREKRGVPGWSLPPAGTREEIEARPIQTDSEFMGLMSVVVRALAAYPEAREAVCAAVRCGTDAEGSGV